jgi:surface antigen
MLLASMDERPLPNGQEWGHGCCFASVFEGKLMKKIIGLVLAVLVVAAMCWWYVSPLRRNISCQVGDPIDSLNHVVVYFNSGTGTIAGRNITDGYNVGLKYQCVEFVKRYYFQYYHHRMPDVYGNAVDFFDKTLDDGHVNRSRDLVQFTNPSAHKPEVGDLIVMDASGVNGFGHVCIVSKVEERELQIIQQNPGRFVGSRKWFDLESRDGKWYIDHARILGWLRMRNE